MSTEATLDVSAILRAAVNAMREGLPSDASGPEETRSKSNRIAEGLYNLMTLSALLANSRQSLTGQDVGMLRALVVALEDALNEFPDHRLATGSGAVPSFTEVAQHLANVRAAIEHDSLTPAALATMRELVESLGMTISRSP